jgi:hypothetical protein
MASRRNGKTAVKTGVGHVPIFPDLEARENPAEGAAGADQGGKAFVSAPPQKAGEPALE